MRQAVLGVVYDNDNGLRIPVEDGVKAIMVALRDPTIPQGVRDWMADNFLALEGLVRALGAAKETWIRIPLDEGWALI
jgi:hypothetical protein